jgi:uncharacterized YccA/Bax inhibitor family protein
MSNPALSNNPALNGKTLTAEELQRIYNQPAADTQRPGVDAGATAAAGVAAATHRGNQFPTDGGSTEPMTYENTISKTVFLFMLVVAGAAVGWWMPALMLPGLIVGLVLGLVNAFKKEPSVPLIIGYAAAQGLFLGGISMVFNTMYDGIVMQAILGTLSVFAVTLLLFRSGKVRTSPKMNKIVMIAMGGYLVFSLLNLGLMMFGVVTNPWGLRSGWIGVAIGVVAILLAAYSLVMDFELIKNGVENRVPEKWGWSAAFGLMVTLIWLYIEILRILAILRGD